MIFESLWPLAFLLAVPVVVILCGERFEGNISACAKGDRHASVFESVVEEAFL